ncbi:MAG: hypothetical protein SGILL_000761 [Bacillariaceae sp.]
MDAARRSMIVAQQLQQQAAAAQQQRGSFFAPPVLGAQQSFSYSPAMQAQMMAQMQAQQIPPMVAVARLANCNKKKPTNSKETVKSTVPRYNVTGGLYTVAQWARKCVEDNVEFLVKLIRRRSEDEKVVMLVYGDGCQTIVFLDDAINKMPKDIDSILKIGIGVSSAPKDDKADEAKMAKEGVLQATDSVWDHLRYEQTTEASKDKTAHFLFIHTAASASGDAADGRRRILQVETDVPKKPWKAIKYVPNPVFEQQVLSKWKGPSVGITQEQVQRYSMLMMQGAAPGMMFPQAAMGAAAAAAYVAANTSEEQEEGILITFNPKELILLEKAFDNKLTKRDLKSKGDKWTEEDKKNCQSIIKRAHNEFKYVRPKKKADPNKKNAVKKTTPAKRGRPPKAKTTPAKKSPVKQVAAVKTEADDGSDSDNEPISKLKAKKEAAKKTPAKKKATPVKKGTPAKKKAAPVKKKTPVKTESPKKRGRAVKKEAPPAKKTRSATKPTRSRK